MRSISPRAQIANDKSDRPTTIAAAISWEVSKLPEERLHRPQYSELVDLVGLINTTSYLTNLPMNVGS